VSVHCRVCGRTSVRKSDAITWQRPLPACPTYTLHAGKWAHHCEGRVCAPEADDLANAGKDGHELFLGRIVRNVTDCVREWVLSGVCVYVCVCVCVWCARERVTRWCKWVASVELTRNRGKQRDAAVPPRTQAHLQRGCHHGRQRRTRPTSGGVLCLPKVGVEPSGCVRQQHVLAQVGVKVM
jgi:hypothetical protein